MFREMRRKKQELPKEEAISILRQATSGVLAVEGDGGYPYAVPLSFVYADGKIFFHCAKEGHKLDAIRRNDRASFCVIAQDQVVPEEYTTYFRSAIAFGQVRILEGDEALAAVCLLCEKYAPGDLDGRDQEIRNTAGRLCMLELSVEHLTGKECIELTRKRTP